MSLPEGWDTLPPRNINDDQIWPGMMELPKEQDGATEMILCLIRAHLGKLMGGVGRIKDFDEAGPVINNAEREIEDKYIRYCDITNPLHFLTVAFGRSAICAMRLRSRLPKTSDQNVPDEDRSELLKYALKILETDRAAHANTSLQRYMWHVGPFFAWGSWDSLIFVLTSLRKPGVLSPTEVNHAWTTIEQVYTNHAEILHSKRAVQIALRRLALRAWNANPPSISVPEPEYILLLRSLQKPKHPNSVPSLDSNFTGYDSNADFTSLGPSPSSDANALFGSLGDGMSLNLGQDFNLDNADWMFWEQLIKDYQVHGEQQHNMFSR